MTQVTDHGEGLHSIKVPVPVPDNPLGHTLPAHQ
jgi:hypothetical protein